MSTPLAGVRVVELAGLAPGPFGCMLLADLGADVVRVDRPRPAALAAPPGPIDRGRRTVTLDLKTPAGVDGLLALVARADVLVEGHRPGVAERLGFGPAACQEINPRLVYARMTGWGQDGPLAARAGHDIDYIALAGALEPLGRAGERPHAPLNLIGDFAGGGMLLALGVLAALLERERSGRGQVVDAAMVDGSAVLTAFLHGMLANGLWASPRGENTLDGGAPFYDTYETSDGGYVAVGALEPAFYAALIDGLGLPADLPGQYDRDGWPELRKRIADRFRTRTRDEWAAIFAEKDACVVPVLSPAEAPAHPHNRARGTFVEVGGVIQPAPAPRFGRTPTASPRPPAAATVAEILAGWSERIFTGEPG
jgi:alpha-methylacyl-CoA racemase